MILLVRDGAVACPDFPSSESGEVGRSGRVWKLGEELVIAESWMGLFPGEAEVTLTLVS